MMAYVPSLLVIVELGLPVSKHLRRYFDRIRSANAVNFKLGANNWTLLSETRNFSEV
jgi:hypothetical protein